MKSIFFRTVLCALAACTNAIAQEVPTATHEVGFSNVRLGVIDLTPDDGTAASFAIDFVNTRHEHRIDRWRAQPEVELQRGINGDQPSAYTSTFMSAVAATQSAAIGGIIASATTGYDLAWGHARAVIQQVVTLTLDAHSMLTFSGDYFRSVSTNVPSETDFRNTARFEARIESGDTSFELSSSEHVTSLGDTVTNSFWYAIGNPTNIATTVTVTLGATAVSRVSHGPYPFPLPVPEPSTWSMLLAGLALTGVAARRARQKKRTGPPRRAL